MKTKILLLSLLFSGATFLASAQNAPQRERGERGGNREFNKEQMQARADSARIARTAFVVEKAGLTAAEQAAFLPLYQEYQTKLREARQASRQAMRAARQNESAVDYAQLNSTFVAQKVREAELLQEYSAKFNQVLPAEKAWKVFQAEKRFHQKAFKRGEKNASDNRGRRGCERRQNNAAN